MEGNSEEDDARSRNRPPVLARRPADRHYFNRINQRSLARERNTVIHPRVAVAADVAAINRGDAVREGDRYTVNGRTYVLEPTGTLAPTTGDGFFLLNRGAYSALRVYRTFGITERAERYVGRMPNVGPDERLAARSVIRSVLGEV